VVHVSYASRGNAAPLWLTMGRRCALGLAGRASSLPARPGCWPVPYRPETRWAVRRSLGISCSTRWGVCGPAGLRLETVLVQWHSFPIIAAQCVWQRWEYLREVFSNVALRLAAAGRSTKIKTKQGVQTNVHYALVSVPNPTTPHFATSRAISCVVSCQFCVPNYHRLTVHIRGLL